MQKWEYKTVSMGNGRQEAERILNQLGEQGWELVFIEEYSFYLKRPKS